MASQLDQLMQRLRDEKLAKKVREWSEKVHNEACWLYYGDADPEDFPGYQGDWERSLEFATMVDWPETLFEDVVRADGTFAIVTAQELGEALYRYFERADGAQLNDGFYAHFLDYVFHHLVLTRSSGPIPLCRLTVLPDARLHDVTILAKGYAIARGELLGEGEESFADALHGLTNAGGDEGALKHLWTSDGLEIAIAHLTVRGRVALDPSGRPVAGHEGELFIEVRGDCSQRVMDLLVGENVDHLRSIVRTCGHTIDTSPFLKIDTEAGRLPEITLSGFQERLPFIRSCVSALFKNPGKKDNFDRRIANAVRLLSQADRQRDDAIGTALCVTAVDALLGQNESEMTEKLALVCSVLLEPQPTFRDQARVFVKRLYAKRSQVLHGSCLDGKALARTEARRLAAAVLFAVWFRLDSMRRMGYTPDTPQKLIGEELPNSMWLDGLPMGVLEMPSVTLLWRREKTI